MEEQHTDSIQPQAEQGRLPQEFVAYMRGLLGTEVYEAFESALGREPVVSIRPNPGKPFGQEGQAPVLRPVPWSALGCYVDERPTFTFDPLFHAGCYYVQEASSMFVEQVLRRYVPTPATMLDLCAAPGGKSTHARSVLPAGSLLVSNEVMRGRVQVLAENLAKWGHPDVVVTNNDPAGFAALTHFFDVVLADVPCSGEGMFRKDPAAVAEWSPDNVALCWQRQRRIVADVWPALKPGGLLIYSTCTFNIKEDEDNIAWMVEELGAEPLAVPVQPAWQITGDLSGRGYPVYRFLPHKTSGEGFFLAAVRKPLEDYCPCTPRKEKKKDKRNKPLPVPQTCRAWLQHADAWQWECRDNRVVACPSAHWDALQLLRQHLQVVAAGVEVAELKGKDCIPAHALAMSTELAPSAFAACGLTYQQAIAYLRKEALQLPPDTPRGYVLLTYRGRPLGFVKNLGNRANNLYPAEWRIRSGHLPETVKCL